MDAATAVGLGGFSLAGKWRDKPYTNSHFSRKNTNANNFADSQKLQDHFDKHGKEFGGLYSSPSEYLSGARNVVKNGYKVLYEYKGEIRTGYVLYMGNTRGGEAKFAFVGTNNQGNITTYHVESGKDFWKMINPIE